jgi:peptide-methionine (S)-S-oxide reductase
MTFVHTTIVTSILVAGTVSAATLAATNDTRGAAGKAVAGDKKMEKATFAAGCFWGVEAAFRKVTGVTKTTVGYTGGSVDDPTYKQVCSGDTGHAEAVEVIYDPQQVTFEDLLAVFWSCHNPTQLNRQGPDIGTQYRSVIFYHSPEQKTAAQVSKAALEKSGKYNQPIVTQIVDAKTFYRAEEYHQQYLEKRGLATCRF